MNSNFNEELENKEQQNMTIYLDDINYKYGLTISIVKINI